MFSVFERTCIRIRISGKSRLEVILVMWTRKEKY